MIMIGFKQFMKRGFMTMNYILDLLMQVLSLS